MKQYPNIDAIIEDSDTKVQDLAKVIGVSTKQIRRWRDGTSEMGIEKLEKLCRYYHVSADYILGLPRDLDWPRATASARAPRWSKSPWTCCARG